MSIVGFQITMLIARRYDRTYLATKPISNPFRGRATQSYEKDFDLTEAIQGRVEAYLYKPYMVRSWRQNLFWELQNFIDSSTACAHDAQANAN